MLRLIAEGPGGSFKAPCKVIVEVHRLAGTRLADYWIQALDPFGVPLEEGHLRSYPRWAEPLSGFAARCLATLPADSTHLNQTVHAGRYAASLSRGQRVLARVEATVPPAAAQADVGRTVIGVPASQGALWLALLAVDAFGSPTLPPVPVAQHVPLIRVAGSAYARLSDLPAEAHRAFIEWKRGRARRLVTYEADAPSGAASPSEVARFLDGHD